MQVLLEQLEIGSDPTEVGRARRWARARLAGAGVAADEPLAETLILLISELVTNAVVHTGCPAVLCMLLPRRCGGEGPCETVESVRVEVADTSSRAPHHRQAEGGDTGGRGLELVSGLADRWGWEHEPGGKRVWCELDAAPPEPGCVLAPPVYGEMRGARAVGESRAHPEAARLEGGARSRTETRSDATMPMRTRVNVVEAGAGAFG
ncbi:ATP-binding protein [Streptomyces diacarni]|uniref:ATP-binding protein n=1 Tax=Streptomyces diacarni TaxID=2800381 RepID=A0A367FCS3_9ACTN|nr:ATP-binding protein [Streptomyces diacarni]RCG28071.1 ATP-binding protein [Streptomyces diacarni]